MCALARGEDVRLVTLSSVGRGAGVRRVADGTYGVVLGRFCRRDEYLYSDVGGRD